MFPRWLITTAHALQVLAAKRQTFFFMPAMAFTVVLFTNIFVVAAVRSKSIPVESGCPGGVAPQAPVALSLPVSPGFRTRDDQLSRLSVGKTSCFYGCLDHLGSPQIVQVKHSKKPA
jgi:hypothetical protein